MTEDEAKTKCCCGPKGCGKQKTEAPYYNHQGRHCIGSECMALRRVPDHEHTMSNGLTVFTDKADADLGDGLWWDGKYAKNTHKNRLHQLIAERQFGPIEKGFYVDHIDGNVLNNRRGNLRIVTPQQSGANQKSRGGKSKYRGVSQQANGRWAVQLSSNGVRWCLGTYDTEEAAAKTYDDKAKEIHGEFARLNLETIKNSGAHFYCGLAGKP